MKIIRKVLFIVNDQGSWIDRDKAVISSHFDVAEVRLKPNNYNYLNRALLAQVFRSDVLFFWFGSLQFLPLILLGKLLGKKILIVAGGYDVAKAELIHHGAFCESSLRQWLRRVLFRGANKVIAVSKANYKEAIDNAHIAPSKLELIYHGFEAPLEELTPWSSRPQKVIMIATALQSTFILKGIPEYIEIARMNPDYEFVLLGAYDDYLKQYLEKNPVSNLRVKGYLPFGSKEFVAELQSSRFVFQLSYYESFGAAVVDAGMYGCYPVVYGQYSLVEVAEGIGRCFPYGDRAGVSQFLSSEAPQIHVLAESIRTAYQQRFPLQRRRELLIKAVSDLAS
jgi:glycosyltransferase involved in cell wall biosynthesis